MNQLITTLRSIVGHAQVLTHDDPATDLSAWEQDWRKRMRGRALAVVRPGHTAEVAAVVKACAAAGVSIVPQGGNTGLVVGAVPDDSGTQVVKIFLNLSKDVQRKRFLERIDQPEKNWKFSPADLQERDYWDAYRSAFSRMLSNTSTKWAPWYVVPADHKWVTRLITSAIVLHTLDKLDPQYPKVNPQVLASLAQAKVKLQAE